MYWCRNFTYNWEDVFSPYQKVSKHRRIRGKYLSELGNLRYKNRLRIRGMYSENRHKESMRTRRRSKETLGVFSTPRDIKVFISQLLIIILIFYFLDSFYSIYSLWDGFNQKTISRYCSFKEM